MKPPSTSPVYCAVYPELAEIARAHGYALAVHGSMASDFDLVAIPWTNEATAPDRVLDAITGQFAFELGECVTREHGRLACSLLGRHGWIGHLDISFMPRVKPVDHSLCCRNCGCIDGGKCETQRLCDDCREYDEDMPRIGAPDA